MADALERFRAELASWSAAHCRLHGTYFDDEELYARVRERVPASTLEAIGAAFERGWLKTRLFAEGRHFIEPIGAGSPPPANLRFLLDARGGLWWELLSQLGDYAELRAAAEPRGLQVLLEHRLMDLTVWSGSELLLYVENCESQRSAEALLARARRYGEDGFDLTVPGKGNDGLRIARRLCSGGARPSWFGLSAGAYKRLFKVEHEPGSNRFGLVQASADFSEALHASAAAPGAAPPRSDADALALELKRQADDFFVADGSGETNYEIYMASDRGEVLALRLRRDGRVWTDVERLGPQSARRMADALRELAIDLDTDAESSYWTRGGDRFVVSDADPLRVATAITQALSSRAGAPRVKVEADGVA
jgi:hypothetical protein